MSDAMLWTVIATFITALAGLIAVAGFLLTRIDRQLERMSDRIDKVHDDVTGVKADLALIGQRLTRHGL